MAARVTPKRQKFLIIDIVAIVSAPYHSTSEYTTSLRNLNDNDMSERHEKTSLSHTEVASRIARTPTTRPEITRGTM
jgi:hypothetical protein